MTSLTLVSTIKSRFTSDYSQAKLFTQSYRLPGSHWHTAIPTWTFYNDVNFKGVLVNRET